MWIIFAALLVGIKICFRLRLRCYVRCNLHISDISTISQKAGRGLSGADKLQPRARGRLYICIVPTRISSLKSLPHTPHTHM